MKQPKLEIFENQIKEIYPGSSESVLLEHQTKGSKSFWITEVQNENEILENLSAEGVQFAQTPIPNAYLTSTNSKISKTKPYLDGQIYIQGLSSMLPVLSLRGEFQNVLDMCASPGSKTIQAYHGLKFSKLYANELSKNRIYKLKDNLSKYGCKEVEILNYDGVVMHHKRPDLYEYFDAVLVDAPCSNEANIFFDEPKSYANWNPKKSKTIAKTQKGLLNSAFQMLKKGGILVYSTCTYSVAENEAVVDWLLKKNDQARILDLDFGLEPRYFQNGLTSFRDKFFNPEVSKSIRVLPADGFRGFFIAKFTKT